MIGEESSRRRVRFVTKRWAHHSTHSGYDRIIDYIGSAVPPIDLDRLSSRWIPERFAIPFQRRAGVHQYFLPSFYAEWAAAREMIVRPAKTTYHVLYGDDTYRSLGQVRRWRGHRLVVSYHVPPDDLRERLEHTDHLGLADAIVVVGTNQLPFFHEACGEDRVHFIPHGVDTEVFRPAPEGAPRGPEDGHILFVGSHRRDFRTLESVIERLERSAPEQRVVLVTKASAGAALSAHRNVELRSGVSEQELISLYREASVVLQPMEESTANNAILEALACGTPVVATDIGGVRDYMDDACGALVPPDDPEAMVEATMDISRHEGTRREKGEAARRRAESLAWPKIASRFAELYESIR